MSIKTEEIRIEKPEYPSNKYFDTTFNRLGYKDIVSWAIVGYDEKSFLVNLSRIL